MNAKLALFGGILAVALIAPSKPIWAEEAQPGFSRKLPEASFGYRLAENCTAATTNARTCYDRWKSMGGGTTGQAGSFYECLKTYCNALVAAGCPQPSFCP